MAVKRLTRKEIVQEDRIHALLSQISTWVVSNRTYLAVVAVILVLGTIGFWILRGYRERQAAELQGLFSDALQLYHAPIDKPEPEGDKRTPEQKAQIRAAQLANFKYRFDSEQEKNQKAEEAFRKVAEDYPDSRLGILSRYYLALIAQQTGRAEEAKKGLTWVIENGDSVETKNLARNTLAEINLGEDKPEEAARLLEKMVEEPSPNYPEQVLLMKLAQSYEKAGQLDKALEHYKKITAEYPTSQQSRDAQSRINELENSETPKDKAA